MPLIDTHCHLDFDAFEADRTSLVSRCGEKGITRFVIPGVTQERWERLLVLGDEFPEIYIAPGLHPCFTSFHRSSHLEQLKLMIEAGNDKILAIGEVGLDYFDKEADHQWQIFLFEQQVKLATASQLPLLLHVRKAHDEVLKTVRNADFSHGGIVHCYSGSLQQAEKYVENGFKLGIGGVITYENSHRLQKIVSTLPLSSFVLETDAPDIPPASLQGRINTPETLPEICLAFARYREETFDVVVDGLYRNTLELFPQLED